VAGEVGGAFQQLDLANISSFQTNKWKNPSLEPFSPSHLSVRAPSTAMCSEIDIQQKNAPAKLGIGRQAYASILPSTK
jgi:hypothetical protein